jgi:hypothetical protein
MHMRYNLRILSVKCIASSFRNKPHCAEGVPMFWKYCSWHPHGKCPWDGMGAFLNIWQRQMSAKWVQRLGKQRNRVLFNGRQPCGSFYSTYFLLNHLHIYMLFTTSLSYLLMQTFYVTFPIALLLNITHIDGLNWKNLDSLFLFRFFLSFLLNKSLPTG